MLYDAVPVSEIVDSPCAQEFLREATRLASSEELAGIGLALDEKSRKLRQTLAPEALSAAGAEELASVLARIFFLRRKARRFVEARGLERLREAIARLLHSDAPVEDRLESFVEGVGGLREPLLVALATELLHFTTPESFALWTPWIWDRSNGAGALPLVLEAGQLETTGSLGRDYREVDLATLALTEAGQRHGFARVAHGPFATDVFLACVYGVYMRTVVTMRLSKEMNDVLPELGEMAQRILGVHPRAGAAQKERVSHV